MSKVLKVVGTIAGAVALVAGTIATAGIGPAAFAATMGSVATYAGLAAGAASLGSSLLYKPPPARGSVTSVVIAANAPQPYVMGEGLFGGVLRYQRSYGATLNKVPNPCRFCVVVYSGAGPIQSITPFVDQASVSSWYSGFLYTDTQLGACPESDALAPQWAGAPGWGSASKLSGKAAIGWSLKFDKDGKRFASGMPQLGAYGQWVKVYDPRADSTFPGGSGAQRVNNESTWAWSENPALHAGTYALGRYQNGKLVMGIGMPADAIDWANVAAWANTCDANGWTLFGAVFEPGDRFANLRDICIAGGAEPVLAADALRFHYHAPRVALDTITAADLLQDEDRSVVAMASWRSRLNTVLPTYRSADHNWELVQAEPVQVSTYLAEDGEVKQADWPFNLVKQADQAAQLARYRLEDSREMQPIVLVCGPRLRAYRPGDCLALDLLDELGLDCDAVIVSRRFDPVKMAVTLELVTETPGKHAYALGEVATPPPTPALGQTGQERDELMAAANNPSAYDALLISTSYTADADPADGLLAATASSVTIESHTRIYSDKTLAITGATLTTLADGTTAVPAETLLHCYYDDGTRSDTTPDFKLTTDPTQAANSAANQARHYVGSIVTDATGGGGTTSGGGTPPGWGGGDWYNLP